MAERVTIGILVGLMAFGLACVIGPRTNGPVPPPLLTTHSAAFELHFNGPLLTISNRDGTDSRPVVLSMVIDDSEQPMALTPESVGAESDAIHTNVPVRIDGATVDAALTLRRDVARDALIVTLGLPNNSRHRVALRARLASVGKGVFVSGVGPIAERATVSGNALLIGLEPHPFAVASVLGSVVVETISDEGVPPGEPMQVSVTASPGPGDRPGFAELHFVVTESSGRLWRSLAELSGVPTAAVHGHVTGVRGQAEVTGRDAQGNPQVRAMTSDAGEFSLDVPTSVVQWYAAVEPGSASTLASFVPGSPGVLVLDIPPEGDVHVLVVDPDTHLPLTARLLFHGMDGSIDPNFGPDYRASGAGPIIDSISGDVTTPLPVGKYRIAATKGIEWSIDAQVVDIVSGRVVQVKLSPRHVVPTPGILGCDLHVHARPSFDSPVTPEDRVLSLAAAGIDFAVPTEHNVVGDYASAIETLDLGKQFASVTGVEVTTYDLAFGHFGVFPYLPGTPVPPYRRTTMAAIFQAVRTDPKRYFQLNHPRLPGGIGYFNKIGFDPQGPRTRVQSRVDFDGIEVYNGFDIREPDRVDQVLGDYWALLDYGWRYTATGSSDSHRIQYQWAGYPRTMVTIAPNATQASDTQPVDPLTVVANLKKSHATVTSGPIIDFVLEGARPGDEAVTTKDVLHGHLRVRAAPWIDVVNVEIVVGQIDGGWTVAQTFDVATRPTTIGPERGTLRDAQSRTVRWDSDIGLSVGPANGWVMAIARGERLMSDVLPFVPVAPLAFTNPVYVVRRRVPIPPFPGSPAHP